MARPDEDPADVKLVLPHPTVVGVPRAPSNVKRGSAISTVSSAARGVLREKVNLTEEAIVVKGLRKLSALFKSCVAIAVEVTKLVGAIEGAEANMIWRVFDGRFAFCASIGVLNPPSITTVQAVPAATTAVLLTYISIRALIKPD